MLVITFRTRARSTDALVFLPSFPSGMKYIRDGVSFALFVNAGCRAASSTPSVGLLAATDS